MIHILLTFLSVFCIAIGLFAFIAKLKVYQETHKNQPFILEVLSFYWSNNIIVNIR